MELVTLLGNMLWATARDVLPVTLLLLFFQYVVLRKPFPEWRRALFGLVLVVLGLTLFLAGLERALFPLGRIMALQLADPARLAPDGGTLGFWSYGSVYLFGAAVGFATTIAEPSLIAVAYKAEQASRGGVKPWGLRAAVAVGVALGIGLGCMRLVSGSNLAVFVLAGYLLVIVQSLFAPKDIRALAYDSGGVTTSTVTVPLVTALGLGLATAVPGRDPALDGFGLIAFACPFAIVSVLTYAQLAQWRARRAARKLMEE